MFKLIACILVFVGFVVAQGPPTCGYDQYKIEGESTCQQCPMCSKGSGVNLKCQRHVAYNLEERPHCVECKDGETFSNYESTDICNPCSLIDVNQKEVTKCTKFHDRYSECNYAYFEDGAHHMCNQQCCYCEGRTKLVKKCEKDNVTNRMFCAPTRWDGICDKRVPEVTSIPTPPPAAKIVIPTIPSVVEITPTSNTSLATNSSVPPTSSLPNSTVPQIPIPTMNPLPRPTIPGPTSETTPFSVQKITSATLIPPTGKESVYVKTAVICVAVISVSLLLVVMIWSIYKKCRSSNEIVKWSKRTRENCIESTEERKSLHPMRETSSDIVPMVSNDSDLPLTRNSQVSNESDLSLTRNSQVLNDSDLSLTRNSQVLNDSVLSLTRNSQELNDSDLSSTRNSQGSSEITNWRETLSDIVPICTKPLYQKVLNDIVVSSNRSSQVLNDSGVSSIRNSQVLIDSDLSSTRNSQVLNDSGASSTRSSPALYDPGASSTRSSQAQRNLPTNSDNYAVCGLCLNKLRYMQRSKLAHMLDIRGEGIRNNWLHIGHYVAGSDKFLKTLVDRCHESYYGGGVATMGMFETLSMTKPDLTVTDFVGIALQLERLDVIKYITDNNVSNEKFVDIPDNKKKCIADLLERRVPGRHNWKSFADLLGFNFDEIEYLRMKKKGLQQYSPTLELIMVLTQHRPHFTVEDLQRTAVAMDRKDVSEYLEQVIQDQHNVLDIV